MEVRDLTKSFTMPGRLWSRRRIAVPAVQDVSFAVRPGETMALVGETGAGKSTVGRLIMRLVAPDGGRILFNGRNIGSYGRRDLVMYRKAVRMIFQDPYSSLDPRMVIGSAVGEPLAIHTDMDRPKRRHAVVKLLEQVGLDEGYFERFPYEMSGGQLQRVAIARAIATEPQIIVCDEPVAALDMSIRAQVMNLLHDLQVERSMAYIFITHDLSLVRLIADTVAVMHQGHIVEAASVEELFARPRHTYTRALLASVPVIDPARRHRRYRVEVDQEGMASPHRRHGCRFEVDETQVAKSIDQR